MGVGMVLMILSMKKGPPSVSWSVCQSSMVIPFSLGVLLNGEKSNAFNLIGLLAVVIGIAVFGRRRGSTPGQGASPHGSSWFYMALAGFAVIGLSQYFFSLPSYWPGWIDSYALRIPIQALAGMLFLAALRPSCLLGGGRSLLLFGAIFAGLTFLGRFCLYKSIDSLALVKMVSIAYPVCLGLSILGFVACDAVARRRFDAATAAISLLLAAGIVLLGFK
jgi:drug/metabolite transporter (DMT)-like permease